MTETSDKGAEVLFDATPFLRLVIDKDGRWFQNGAEIIHQAIYREFCSLLEETSDGGYRIRLGREVCRVEVEDAPFVVLQVTEEGEGKLCIRLNDGSVEPFVADNFWIGKENVPYTHIKAGKFHARFSRPAYYQLAPYIVSDESEKEFFLLLDGKRLPIRSE
jgi:uncharacterized protein